MIDALLFDSLGDLIGSSDVYSLGSSLSTSTELKSLQTLAHCFDSARAVAHASGKIVEHSTDVLKDEGLIHYDDRAGMEKEHAKLRTLIILRNHVIDLNRTGGKHEYPMRLELRYLAESHELPPALASMLSSKVQGLNTSLFDLLEALIDLYANAVHIELDEYYRLQTVIRFWDRAAEFRDVLRCAITDTQSAIPHDAKTSESTSIVIARPTQDRLSPPLTIAFLTSDPIISHDTFRRIRDAAGVTMTKRGRAASKHTYSTDEIESMIAAAIDSNFTEAAAIAKSWQRYLS